MARIPLRAKIPFKKSHLARLDCTGGPVVVAGVNKSSVIFVERRLNRHARRILDGDLNALRHDLGSAAVLGREHDSRQAVGVELDVATGVEAESETGVGEQMRAAGLPELSDRAAPMASN